MCNSFTRSSLIEPPTAIRVSLNFTIVAPTASNFGPVISMFHKKFHEKQPSAIILSLKKYWVAI